jgi:hypothetical protein
MTSNALKQTAFDQFIAEIDKQIYETLDNIAPYCKNEEHAGYAGLVSLCSHPDCIVRSVMDK